ncbi:MAG: uncharacterized membrane protein YtjA (UPF0391 family) [Bradyrhizobium sp.]
MVPEIGENFAVSPSGTSVPLPICFLKLWRRAKGGARKPSRGLIMLSWVVTFLVIALIAGILGFGGIAGASIEIAKAIFFIAIILFLVSAVVGLARGRTRV